jgi:hypothetical protein
MKPLAAIGIAMLVWLGPASRPARAPTQIPGNETSAIVSLRAITVAQIAYSGVCGYGGYASSLKTLATPPPGGSEGFVSKDLGSAEKPEKAGYQFTLAAGAGAKTGAKDCNGWPTVTSFYATATPLKVGVTGTKSFATSEAVTIWQLEGGAAPKQPFGPPAVKIQ